MKSMKKIAVSLLTAVALTGSAFGAFAADANSIKSCNITIVNSDNTETSVTDTTNIAINPNQMLKFEVELTNDGDVTLFSAKNGETTYDNGTIQYVAQSASKATITFKPRATLGEGTYSVKVGGTDVAEAQTYTYTVESQLKITPVNKYAMSLPKLLTADVYDSDYATYTISGVDSVDDLVVKEGETAFTKDTDYTVSKNSDNTFTLVIKNKFTDVTVGTHTLTATVGGMTKDFDVEVCNAIIFNTNVAKDGGGYKNWSVYAPLKSDSVTLKPVESALSTKTPKAKVVSQGGYFKGYQPKGDTINVYSVESNTTIGGVADEFNAVFGEAQNGTVNTDIITKAGAQAIKYKDSSSAEKEAIRFIALIDFDESYTNAGFVVSDLHYNPTIEGGFAKSAKNEAYDAIYARTTSGDTASMSVADLKSEIKGSSGADLNAGLDAIITSVLNVSSDAQKDRTIYATPYVVKSDGTRVYGETIGVKYNDLITASTGE